MDDGAAELIQQVKKRPILYDTTRVDYRAGKQPEIWVEIGQALKSDPVASMELWFRLRKRFGGLHLIAERMKKLGRKSAVVKWPHYKALDEFLVIEHRGVENSSNDDQEPQEETPVPPVHVENQNDNAEAVMCSDDEGKENRRDADEDRDEYEDIILSGDDNEYHKDTQTAKATTNEDLPRSSLAKRKIESYGMCKPKTLPPKRKKIEEATAKYNSVVEGAQGAVEELREAVQAVKEKATRSATQPTDMSIQDAFVIEVSAELRSIMNRKTDDEFLDFRYDLRSWFRNQRSLLPRPT